VYVLVLYQVARKLKASANIVVRQVGEVIRGDVVKALSGGDQIDNLRYLNPGTLDARLAVAEIGPN